MGFSLTLMIYSAVKRNDLAPGVVLWYPDEVLNCGYINRAVQGVIEFGNLLSNRYVEYPQSLAGTALTSLLLKRFPAYAREQGDKVFAPPFLLEGVYENISHIEDFYRCDYIDEQKGWLKRITTDEQRLVPKGFGGSYYEVWPNLLVQSKHNKNSHRNATSVHGFMDSRPSCWMPCCDLAAWVGLFWQEESTSRLRLETNLRARARLEGWQAQLAAYGAIGSKVLFVFEDYPERLL